MQEAIKDESRIAIRIAKDFGANATYVEDLLRQFRHDPSLVGEEWGTYFSRLLGSEGGNGHGRSATAEAAVASPPAAVAPGVQTGIPAAGSPEPGERPVEAGSPERMIIRGPAVKIVENMETSLSVPMATSIRQIQIKLLDENRRWINRHLESQGRGKTSFTHFIAWAMLKALSRYPQLNDGYEVVDGAPTRLRRSEVNLGVAVDVQKRDGTRTLLVPNLKAANQTNFREFLDAYQDVIRRARDGKLQVSDFQGTTVSLTNPGTIGTTASSPRLMAGQG
ncbi:MAG: 2-oxo acid dehydrogenase subunit E2, partial [Acidobacteriota bacterium]